MVLVAAGCDDSTTLVTDVNPAVRVVIDASRCPIVSKCGSCVLETDAFDKNSQPAQFPTLLWSSANTSIATVDGLTDGQARVNGWVTGGTRVFVEVLETGAADTVGVTVGPSMINCQPPGARSPSTSG
jgi:hypothetical protein